jgi:hypothetical protein
MIPPEIMVDLEGRDLHRFGTIQRVCLILDLEGWDS